MLDKKNAKLEELMEKYSMQNPKGVQQEYDEELNAEADLCHECCSCCRVCVI